MGTPSSTQYFEAIWTSATQPLDPNLFTASQIVAGSFDSAAVSTATSKAVSTISAAAPDSSNLSIADSKAVSSGGGASVADSKSISNSVNISVVDSKGASGSVNTSIADSKAVSVATSTPVQTAVVYSGAISVADSKAVSSVAGQATYAAHRAVSVKDTPYNAVADGIADDTAAILAADAAAALAGGDVFFPPGTYKTSQNLVVSRKWVGVPGFTIIKPTVAVTKCIDLRGGATLDGFYLDGVNTTGRTGIDVGTALLVNETAVRNTQVWRFAGVGGRGIKVAQLVTGLFENVYVDANYINLHLGGTGGTPTDSRFVHCQFREATTKGVWIENGYGMRFYNPLFESNGEEGLYIQNTADNAVEIGIYDPWYENNWTSVASGATRHTKYHFFVDGATGPAGTIRSTQMNAKFSEDTNGARAMHITNCQGYADFNSKCANEAGQLLLDGTTQATITAWNPQNGPFLTTATDSTGVVGAIYNVQSHVQDNIEAAWSTYTPTVTGSGSMTIAALSITKAAYKIIGKTCTVAIVMSFTTGGSGGQQVNITLPTNVRSKDAIVTNICLIADGATTVGYVFPDGTNPTSSLKVGRGDVANWTLGTLRQVNTVFTFELF